MFVVERTTDLPITASASGSLKPVSLGQGISHHVPPYAPTCQIVEVWFLVKLIKYSTRPVLQFIRCKHRDAIPGQLLRQRSTAVVVFESGDAGGDCTSMSTCDAGGNGYGYGSRSPALMRCGWVSCKGCPNWRSAADANVRLARRRGEGLLRKVGTGRDAARNGSRTLLFIVVADKIVFIWRWRLHVKPTWRPIFGRTSDDHSCWNL